MGECREPVKGFAFLGLVINSNGDCSQEIKRRLGLSRPAMELRKIIKSKDMSLETKVKIIYIFIFPTMYGC